MIDFAARCPFFGGAELRCLVARAVNHTLSSKAPAAAIDEAYVLDIFLPKSVPNLRTTASKQAIARASCQKDDHRQDAMVPRTQAYGSPNSRSDGDLQRFHVAPVSGIFSHVPRLGFRSQPRSGLFS